jgi:hypothetical protein
MAPEPHTGMDRAGLQRFPTSSKQDPVRCAIGVGSDMSLALLSISPHRGAPNRDGRGTAAPAARTRESRRTAAPAAGTHDSRRTAALPARMRDSRRTAAPAPGTHDSRRTPAPAARVRDGRRAGQYASRPVTPRPEPHLACHRQHRAGRLPHRRHHPPGTPMPPFLAGGCRLRDRISCAQTQEGSSPCPMTSRPA